MSQARPDAIRLIEVEERSYLVAYNGKGGYTCAAQWRFNDTRRWTTVFPDFDPIKKCMDRDGKDELTLQSYDAILKHFQLYGLRNQFPLAGLRVISPRDLMIYRRRRERQFLISAQHQAYSCEPFDIVPAMFVA
jgi:hypothetical protein